MNIKRIKLILLAIVCVFTLAGCKKNVGAEEDNPVKAEEKEEKQITYKFGFSCVAKENPYYITLANAIWESLQEGGHTVIGMNKDTHLSSVEQIEQINEMIQQGIDAIFLAPVDWKEITPALEALKKADVKIVNIDTKVENFDYVDAYIGSDNKNAGTVCGKDLAEQCENGGKIVILECPTMNSINERITGFEEAIVGKPFEVVARKNVKGDLTIAREETKKILEKNKDITAIMCGNDPSAIGAYIAANELGIKDIKIYGVDGSPELKKELEKPNTLIAGTAAQSPINLGKTAVKVALNILNGEEYEEETFLDTYLITKENIEMYGTDGWQ
ncbi:substrate-binding domain-containing protein [Faecalimonas sp.]